MSAAAAPFSRCRHGGLAVGLALLLLWLYRTLLSPLLALLGARCRYHPSCSEYAAEAVRKWGAWRGGLAAGRRLLSCHPWNPGGVDYP